MMDDMAVRSTEAQLTLWGEEFKKREARLLPSGREPRFPAVLHVDELRVMLVTAQARFEALQACPIGHQDLLTAEFDDAWQELAVAIEQRMPPP
jgi:hypothetical protein